jgi:hypothetical protein
LTKKDQAAFEAFADQLDTLHASLVVAGEGGLMSGREELREKLGNVFGEIVSYDGRPSDSQIQRVADFTAEIEEKQAEFDTIAAETDDLNRILEKRDLELLVPLTREAWEAQQEGNEGSADAASAAVRMLMLGL